MAKSYGTVVLRGGYWKVTCEPHVMIRLKRTFSGISPRQFGTVKLSNTLENCRELVWFLQRFPMEVEERAQLEQRAIAHQTREEDIHKLVIGEYKPREFELAIPAREYQAVAADLALRTGGLLVADQVGLGKTVVGICMLTDPRTRPSLVVTLTHLPKQWENEIHRFAPALRTHIIKKGTPYDVTKVRRKTVPFPDVLIINYHKLAGWAETLAPIINSVVYDEVQELRRGHLSLKGTAAFYLSNSVKWRLSASATPIFNYGGEIYNVIEATQPGALGTEAEFTREWCKAYSEKKSIKQPKVFGQYMRDQGLMLRRTREDVGRELPDLLKVPHHIDCDQKALDDIKGRATELAKVILDRNPLEKGAKFKAAEELSWRLRQATGISKAPYVAAFVRLLIESGEPVVLYGWHRSCYEMWLEMLDDLNPVMYTGSESVTKKQAARDAFVEGRSPLLIMSLRSGAGLDGLQHACRTVVFGELDWSYGCMEQCAGRIHRDGQPSKVVAYYLLADSGSDPVIASVLGIKRSQLEGIRDPKRDLIEKLDTGGDNIKQLAAAYLGVGVPELKPPDAKEEPVQVITTIPAFKVHTVPLPKLESVAAQLTESFDFARLNIREVTPEICGLLALLQKQLHTAIVVTVSKDPKTANLLEYSGYRQLFEIADAPVPTVVWAQQPNLVTASQPTSCKTIWKSLLSSSLAQTCLELLPANRKFIDTVRDANCKITVVTNDPRYEKYAIKLSAT